jgi:glyoxylase I family protein
MARIEHFALFAADSPALKDFYVNVMGMKVALESGGDPPGFFLIDDNGVSLEIIGRPGDQSGVNQRWVCHLAFSVDDVDAKRRELEGLGFVFETETVVDNEAMKTCFFRDPEQNRCQIIWRRKPLGT